MVRLETSLEQSVVCPETIKPIDEERFYRGIESLPQTLIFLSMYLSNPMLQTLNISTMIYLYSNILSLKYPKFTSLGC